MVAQNQTADGGRKLERASKNRSKPEFGTLAEGTEMGRTAGPAKI